MSIERLIKPKQCRGVSYLLPIGHFDLSGKGIVADGCEASPAKLFTVSAWLNGLYAGLPYQPAGGGRRMPCDHGDSFANKRHTRPRASKRGDGGLRLEGKRNKDERTDVTGEVELGVV